ncbi:methyltransferase domain-containing protein [Candidatus Trichorickettsia mobilis]|uniref:hypothetical protein n=1 Tax=Candidatus Trichorickettsia mobilis TaxID=1346319 RepID=UPI00292EFEF5|nr:hypothetical protein [Candidatus Trichorickettsia mobilis]
MLSANDKKIQNLTTAVHEVLNNKQFAAENEYLMTKFNISTEEIVDAYIEYDLDIFSYSNEIYGATTNRLVLHLHNQLKNSWHIDRQNIVERFIQELNCQHMADIGFGVPQQYLKNFLTKEQKDQFDLTKTITLIDFEKSALEFAATLLHLWNPTWSQYISLQQQDMTILCERKQILAEYDLLIFQDSIEHVPDPSTCLKSFVSNSKNSAKFLLSLPIGSLIPSHHIEWKDIPESKNWLAECGLAVTDYSCTSVNPAVDLFAEQLNYNLTNYIVVCQKL